MCFIYITLPTSWAEMVQNRNKTICLALGNRVWNIVPLNTSPCLLSTPSAPYADWSGFNVLLSRDFNTVPVWDNIGILNTNTVCQVSLFVRCYWGLVGRMKEGTRCQTDDLTTTSYCEIRLVWLGRAAESTLLLFSREMLNLRNYITDNTIQLSSCPNTQTAGHKV